MDLDTSDSSSSDSESSGSESTSSESKWPNGNVYLTPGFLELCQERLVKVKDSFRKFLEEQDPEVGFKLEWMLAHICERCFATIHFIARQVPRKPPMDPFLATVTSELASELQAISGNDKPPAFISAIDALPNPEWDEVFQGYCRVLEASVETYVLGDTPVYQSTLADAAAPDQVYEVLRLMIVSLQRFPCLQNYTKRVLRKLDGSRSGAIWTQWWLKEAQVNPPPKRKLDELGLDEDAKERILQEMSKYPKLDRLLSCPPGLR
ncbi:hypothetical protein EV127DRAFT_482328 [Xylaria flabelliformis]|nr:hypothetical protein EV127DRAFT_482328 [Xylaria flabelliformis]